MKDEPYTLFMAESIEGKKALVVGGSGGIGAAVSRALAREGVSLIIHGGHDEGKLRCIAGELAGMTEVRSILCPLDEGISGPGAARAEELVSAVREADIICMCYGPFLQKPLDETSSDEWRNVVGLNLTLPGQILSIALPGMRQREWGRILLFGGTGSSVFRGYRTNAAYGAAKTGLCNLAKSVAVEYSGFGITCNAILPGFTDTEYVPEAVKKVQSGKMPQGKLIGTDEIGETAVFLLKMGCINGAILNVDRGWTP